MKIFTLILTTFVLSGCGSNAADLDGAIKQFSKACSGTLSGEFHASTYNNAFTLKCDQLDTERISDNRQSEEAAK